MILYTSRLDIRVLLILANDEPEKGAHFKNFSILTVTASNEWR